MASSVPAASCGMFRQLLGKSLKFIDMLPVLIFFRCPCSTFKWIVWPGKQVYCLDAKCCWNYEVSGRGAEYVSACQHCCQALFFDQGLLHDLRDFYTILRDFCAILHDFYTTYAIFCQAQIFCCQAPKTILHPCRNLSIAAAEIRKKLSASQLDDLLVMIGDDNFIKWVEKD